MKKHLPGFVAGVGASAVAAWLAWPVDIDVRPGSTGASLPQQPQATADVSAPTSTTRVSTPDSIAPKAQERASSRQEPAPAAKAVSAPALELPGGGLTAQRSGDLVPLDKLLSSMRVRCVFDRGAGGQWPSGKLFPHTAAWQGGPVDFESVDILDNRARLVGSQGLTGTIDGITDIRVTATNSGLHFSGFKPDGELFATTVFGALDSDGRYLAVMSTHGTGFDHESAQFYGACTL